jgi:hypothetical protein
MLEILFIERFCSLSCFGDLFQVRGERQVRLDQYLQDLLLSPELQRSPELLKFLTLSLSSGDSSMELSDDDNDDKIPASMDVLVGFCNGRSVVTIRGRFSRLNEILALHHFLLL